jgi:hypothetical protein
MRDALQMSVPGGRFEDSRVGKTHRRQPLTFGGFARASASGNLGWPQSGRSLPKTAFAETIAGAPPGSRPLKWRHMAPRGKFSRPRRSGRAGRSDRAAIRAGGLAGPCACTERDRATRTFGWVLSWTGHSGAIGAPCAVLDPVRRSAGLPSKGVELEILQCYTAFCKESSRKFPILRDFLS